MLGGFDRDLLGHEASGVEVAMPGPRTNRILIPATDLVERSGPACPGSAHDLFAVAAAVATHKPGFIARRRLRCFMGEGNDDPLEDDTAPPASKVRMQTCERRIGPKRAKEGRAVAWS